MSNTYVAIMAGGIGSRFWPKSRITYPKQFIDILGVGKSLIQMTYDRFLKVCPKENIFIVTNEKYEAIVREQLPDLADNQILKEPLRRNTAPCIAYAAEKIFAIDPAANMVVAPSDHLILDEDKFSDIIKQSLKYSKKDSSLITLGIVASRPDTGYGYIQYNDGIESDGFYKVKTFTEKPTPEIAQSFLDSGDFLWNSGIFVWGVGSILKAFQEHLPEVYDIFQEGVGLYNTDKEQAFVNKAYTHCTNISIDYGVMEKADNVYVIPAEFGWSDLGTWESLYHQYEKDDLGNATSGTNVMIHDATNCMVMAPDNKLVVLQGIDNYCVIDTQDVLMICQRDKEQEIKQYTADVKKMKGERFL